MLLLIVVQVQVFFQSGCFPFTFLFPEDSQSVQNRFHRSLKQSVSQRARREIFEKDEMLRKVATRQNVTCMPSMPSLLPILPKSPLSRHPRQNCKSLHVPRQFKRTQYYFVTSFKFWYELSNNQFQTFTKEWKR